MSASHARTNRSNILISLCKYGLLLTLTLTTLPLSMAQAQTSNAKVGGRFMLQDHTGEVVTDKDFEGRFMLITFGYTYCPDICPTNLANMSYTLEILGEQADRLAPIFVTVDPKRDDVEHMADYVSHFDKRLIGLTGPQEMIDSIVDRYKVIYAIHRPEGSGENEYTVDHTASIFLMSPDGDFLVKFAHGMPPEDMAKRIAEFVQQEAQ